MVHTHSNLQKIWHLHQWCIIKKVLTNYLLHSLSSAGEFRDYKESKPWVILSFKQFIIKLCKKIYSYLKASNIIRLFVFSKTKQDRLKNRKTMIFHFYSQRNSPKDPIQRNLKNSGQNIKSRLLKYISELVQKEGIGRVSKQKESGNSGTKKKKSLTLELVLRVYVEFWHSRVPALIEALRWMVSESCCRSMGLAWAQINCCPHSQGKGRKKGRIKGNQSNIHCLLKSFFVRYILYMRNTPKCLSPHKGVVGDFYFLFILCISPGFCNKLVLLL